CGVTVNAADVPPPGAGVPTLPCAGPFDARAPAAIDACSCAAFTNVVGRLAPFQCTVDEAVNPLPFTVSAKGPLPENAWLGDSDVATGCGFKEPSRNTGGLVAACTVLINGRNANHPPGLDRETVE